MIKRICGLIINVQDSKSRGVLESSIEIIRTQSLCLKLDQHRNPHKFFSYFSGAVLLHQTSPTTPKRTSRIPHFLRIRWIFEVEIPRFYLAPSWCMSLCSLPLVALSVGAMNIGVILHCTLFGFALLRTVIGLKTSRKPIGCKTCTSGASRCLSNYHCGVEKHDM